ncbi:Sat1 [Stachybotrys chartarum IBT 7711]|uniref:FAD-dependent monooxygenase SAT1 n=1 Tax=Stachybotrys chartarum (strain CBS 109288 / IBT 7711) TaxID=1280523 RepID=SAT1_STACB|nr:RecName: Full=FAD-dependent monooxygenase SAT1; AltName: Full=Satratoxin biosynthesis SC1 cluster protein 1 [Stachybotrys chartarum IBT 7711]KEY74368.1 Sat1 [Stachybotrys chartarum IBT 7711]
MWASFPRPEAIPPGYVGETQHQHRSIMLLNGKSRSWIFLYERLPAPSHDRVKCIAEDVIEFADSFADWSIWNNTKLEDVVDHSTAGMSNLEEGIVKNFSHGRIVLVGDACHKFTSNAGLGLNNGIQDIVAGCNSIRKVVTESGFDLPDVKALEATFKTYYEMRLGPFNDDFIHSKMMTRMQAWANTWYFLFTRYLFFIFSEWILFRFTMLRRVCTGLVLTMHLAKSRLVALLNGFIRSGYHSFIWISAIRPCNDQLLNQLLAGAIQIEILCSLNTWRISSCRAPLLLVFDQARG